MNLMQLRKLKFDVETDANYSLHKFYLEFKQLQQRGFFKGVKSITKLEESKDDLKQDLLFNKAKVFILEDEYGIK